MPIITSSEYRDIDTAMQTDFNIPVAGQTSHIEDHAALALVLNNMGMVADMEYKKTAENEWEYYENSALNKTVADQEVQAMIDMVDTYQHNTYNILIPDRIPTSEMSIRATVSFALKGPYGLTRRIQEVTRTSRSLATQVRDLTARIEALEAQGGGE